MTVKQLIADLLEIDENLGIYLSCDAEGNAYSPLEEVSFYEGGDDNEELGTKPAIIFYPE